jgi:hypothetical protein
MSEVRATNLQALWANTATAVTSTPGSPVTGTAYRNTSAGSATLATGGFLFNSKSPSEVINQFLYTVSKVIADLQSRGVLGWNSTTLYSVGALTYASDSAVYQCIQGTNTGKDPVSEAAYWTKVDALNRALTTLANITTVPTAADGAVKTAPDVVTSYWVASDGNSFYRKYKSGWIEQGGRSPTTQTGTITFPTIFTTVPFIHVTQYLNSATTGSYYSSLIYDTPSATAFKYYWGGEGFDADSYIYWTASGF